MSSIKTQHHILYITLSILGFLSFSLLDTIVKILSQWYSSLTIAFYMRMFSTAFLLCIIIFILISTQSFRSLIIKNPISHFIRGLMLIIISLGFVDGFTRIPLNTGYSIAFLLPIFTMIFSAIFLKKKLKPLLFFTIIGGFVGILILLRPGIIAFSIGYISILVAVMAEVPFFFMTEHYHKKENPFVVIFYPSLISIVSFPILAIVVKFPITIFSPFHLLLFIAGGLFYVLAQVLIITSFSRIAVPISMAMQYTQILWGSIVGMLIFKDTYFDSFFVIGITIVILCSYIVATKKEPFISTKTETDL